MAPVGLRPWLVLRTRHFPVKSLRPSGRRSGTLVMNPPSDHILGALPNALVSAMTEAGRLMLRRSDR